MLSRYRHSPLVLGELCAELFILGQKSIVLLCVDSRTGRVCKRLCGNGLGQHGDLSGTLMQDREREREREREIEREREKE
jgi:hypothetical protein